MSLIELLSSLETYLISRILVQLYAGTGAMPLRVMLDMD